ncbi:hypothetical protein PLESTF_001778100 [Pleodorina starrii]|nr:hypothetical protein PLESTF_001778100 [Pleodorina starrii]
MDVTFTADGTLQTHALAALRFPLLVSADGATAGNPPVVRLLRAHSASAEAALAIADISVTSSSRIVELHVQAWGDSTPSYAQTLRGTPSAAAPTTADADSVPSCTSAGSGGAQAFMVQVPASRAYPDWRVLQLRFASARGAAGGVCTVHDIRIVPASASGASNPVAVASPAPPGADNVPPSSGDSAASAAAAPGAEHDATLGPSAPETVGSGALSLHGAGSATSTAARGSAGGLADAAGGGGGGAAARAGTAAPPAAGSQMHQLRELLQRAAAAVPPQPPPQTDASAATHGSASTAVPSAAKANLGLAATLARSLLQTQLPPPVATSAAAAQAQPRSPLGPGASPWAAAPGAPSLGTMRGDGGSLAGPEAVGASAGAAAGFGAQAAAAPSALSPAGGALGQAQVPPPHEQPQLGVGDTPGLRPTPTPETGAAGGGGAAAGGFLPLPLTGFLPGPLAAAAVQLADVCTRVRRIEEHLLRPMGQCGPPGTGCRQDVADPDGGAERATDPDSCPGQRPGQAEQQQQWRQQQQQRHEEPEGQLREVHAPAPQVSLSMPSAQLPVLLVEQLLAALPALTAGMVRLEAAVAQQSEQLSELTRQMAVVQRRLDVAAGEGIPFSEHPPPSE